MQKICKILKRKNLKIICYWIIYFKFYLTVVNKFDINIENTEKIEKFAQENKKEVLAKIPHSFCIIEEISKKNIPSINCKELKKPVIEIYNKIKDYFEAEMAN